MVFVLMADASRSPLAVNGYRRSAFAARGSGDGCVATGFWLAIENQATGAAMSAFIVSDHHINLIVSAAISRKFQAPLVPGGYAFYVDANPLEFGRMLLKANIRSVARRYGVQSPQTEAGNRQLENYTFRYYPRVRTAAAYKALLCYDHQACDADDYDCTSAGRFVFRFLELTVSDADNEPWGYKSEADVLAACDPPPADTPARAPVILAVLDISTAHLAPETMAALDTEPTARWPIAGGNIPYGYFIYAHEENDGSIPDDLWACIEFARAHGCSHLRFDRDGEPYTELANFHG
jgi:hypothetical protein